MNLVYEIELHILPCIRKIKFPGGNIKFLGQGMQAFEPKQQRDKQTPLKILPRRIPHSSVVMKVTLFVRRDGVQDVFCRLEI